MFIVAVSVAGVSTATARASVTASAGLGMTVTGGASRGGSRARARNGCCGPSDNRALGKTVGERSGDARSRFLVLSLSGGCLSRGLGSCGTQGDTSGRSCVDVVHARGCGQGWDDGVFGLCLAHLDALLGTAIAVRKGWDIRRNVLLG